MNLDVEGLHIQIAARRAIDDEDWCRVQVAARVPGIQAEFEAYLQGADLSRFVRELRTMYECVGAPCCAVLSSYERGICVALEMKGLGRITGTYDLRPEGDQEVTGELKGDFRMDQSYLPNLIMSAENLLEELQGNEA